MLKPSLDQSRPAATAEAARLYVLAVIYAALGGLAWIATGRHLARPRKEI
ncbi:hypothetical protein [Streptomyces sp. UG1]